MKLYLVRHGESTANKDKIVQGQLDTELTKFGQKQAKKTAERLKLFKIDKIYSSDLKRAKKTAETINLHHDLEIIEDKRLREINRGDWQGKKKSEVDFSTLKGSLFEQKTPNGESVIQQDKRVNEFLTEIINKHKKTQEKILIVAHGHTNKLLLKNLFNLNFKEFKTQPHPTNCSLYSIDLSKERPIYKIRNCNKHLKEKLKTEEIKQ